MSSDCAILCIDDNVESLFVRKRLLELRGFTVFTATNGPSGIEIAKRERIDAVILDYKMPDMRDEIAERLRELNPDLPIIMMSGFVGDLPESIKRLTNTQISKGIAPVQTLIETLERLTHKSGDRLPRKRSSALQEFVEDSRTRRERRRA